MNSGYPKQPRERRNQVERSAPFRRKGFTVIELLVVIGVIVILLSLLAPALQIAKRQARFVFNGANIRDNVFAHIAYADDHRGKFHGTIATWNRAGVPQPTTRFPDLMITNPQDRYPFGKYRSRLTYLKNYIEPQKQFCPNTPREFPDADKASTDWSLERDQITQDSIFSFHGSYFYYGGGFQGSIEENNQRFKGPTTSSAMFGESKVLLGDSFGKDDGTHFYEGPSTSTLTASAAPPPTTHNSYYTCEWSSNGERANMASSYLQGVETADLWAIDHRIDPKDMKLRLQAGMVDGSVISYWADEATKVTLEPTSRTIYVPPRNDLK